MHYFAVQHQKARGGRRADAGGAGQSPDAQKEDARGIGRGSWARRSRRLHELVYFYFLISVFVGNSIKEANDQKYKILPFWYIQHEHFYIAYQ